MEKMGVPDAAAQTAINRQRSGEGSIQGGDVPLGKCFLSILRLLVLELVLIKIPL